MIPTALPRAALASLTTVLTLFALGACGGAGTSSSTPDRPSSARGATSALPSASESTSPSAEPSPSIVSASGPLLEQEGVTVRLPEGWRLSRGQSEIQATGNAPFSQGSAQVNLASLRAINTSDTPDVLARDTAKYRYDGKGRVLPEVSIDGVVMGHAVGDYDDSHSEQYITLYEKQLVSISWYFDSDDFNRRERRALVDSTMASWQWR